MSQKSLAIEPTFDESKMSVRLALELLACSLAGVVNSVAENIKIEQNVVGVSNDVRQTCTDEDFDGNQRHPT
jgi:hypothetical protein